MVPERSQFWVALVRVLGQPEYAAVMASDLSKYPPMLLDERPLDFRAPGWLWEIELDGYRTTARFGQGECELRSRNGADATNWFPELSASLAQVKGGPFVVDGEVCVLDEMGRSDFAAVQDVALRRKGFEGARPVTYGVFDLLACDGRDLTGLPLIDRKKALLETLDPAPPFVLLVGHFEEYIEILFKCEVHHLNLAGLVAKRADSVYQPGIRSADWVKVKRKGAMAAERFKRG